MATLHSNISYTALHARQMLTATTDSHLPRRSGLVCRRSFCHPLLHLQLPLWARLICSLSVVSARSVKEDVDLRPRVHCHRFSARFIPELPTRFGAQDTLF